MLCYIFLSLCSALLCRYYCWDRFESGGNAIRCSEGQTIELDFVQWRFTCVEDNGRCPGVGGIKLGCEDGNLPPK